MLIWLLLKKNRIQNSLTISNITLDSVLSDIFGKSASNILDYILSLDKPEDFNEEVIKTLLCKSAKTKSDDIITSIKGFCIPDSTIVKIKSSRIHLESIQNTVSSIDEEVDRLISSEYQVYVDLAKTVPGISDNSSKVIVSEIGIDMSAFSTSKKLCNWAGLTPQNNESAGKKKSTKVSRAGVYLKPILVQCANAAIKSTKEPYFRNKYLKIKKRRGHKKAIIAIARMMLTCIYKMFQTGETFNPIDINYSDIPEAVLESKREQIIDNAIKYGNEFGTIKISISNKNHTIKIEDDGIGIAKKHQERIFERFYQVDKDRSKNSGGTGLGLAIVKHICVKYNIEIRLKSQLGKGTSIQLIFN